MFITRHGQLAVGSRQRLDAFPTGSDVVILVHGWNVPAHTARRAYRTWVAGYTGPTIPVYWPASLLHTPPPADALQTIEQLPLEERIDLPPEPVEHVAERLGQTTGAKRPLQEGLRQLANLSSYYLIRKRAVLIGETGLANMLHSLLARGVRCHIIGHSFGALAVIAALHEVVRTREFYGSALLCLAACSHYVFATKYDGVHNGAYHALATSPLVRGPIFVVHSKNDPVLRVPYALASRLASHEAAFVGGTHDRYGALGANGALSTPGVMQLPINRVAQFARPGITNVPAHDVLSSHGNLAPLRLGTLLSTLIDTLRGVPEIA